MKVPSDISTSDTIFGSCLHDLLNTFNLNTSALAEEFCRNGLRASLKRLWYCGRAYHRLGNSVPLPYYVRDVFANPKTTSLIQNEPDPTARLIGRCFSSLFVKKSFHLMPTHAVVPTSVSATRSQRAYRLSLAVATQL